MTPNPGHCPSEAQGKRVRVKLRNGSTFEAPADGRGAVDWTNSPAKPFAIVEWEIAA